VIAAEFCPHTNAASRYCLRTNETQLTCRDCGAVTTHTGAELSPVDADLWLQTQRVAA
jgi:hypothetical protein